jgi:hypothetical protein
MRMGGREEQKVGKQGHLKRERRERAKAAQGVAGLIIYISAGSRAI